MNNPGGISLKLLGTLLVVLTLAGVALVAYGQTSPSEQRVFSGSPVQHPVSLSPEVLRVLLASHPAKETFEIMNDPEKHDPSKLFQAAEVHLGSSDEVDLVVIGLGPMRGAESLWFWVVRSARKNPEVILFSGGDSLEVTDKKRTAIRTSALSGCLHQKQRRPSISLMACFTECGPRTTLR